MNDYAIVREVSLNFHSEGAFETRNAEFISDYRDKFWFNEWVNCESRGAF